MRGAAKQSGLSIMGFLFWGLVFVGLAITGIRVVPSYVEYFEVRKILGKSLEEYDGTNMYQVRRNFDLKASAGYIESIKGSDLDIHREGGKVVMGATWAKKIPMFGNVSLLLDFDVRLEK